LQLSPHNGTPAWQAAAVAAHFHLLSDVLNRRLINFGLLFQYFFLGLHGIDVLHKGGLLDLRIGDLQMQQFGILALGHLLKGLRQQLTVTAYNLWH
jgi:hypothetical protein